MVTFLLYLVLGYAYASLGEYFAHRYLMHTKVPGLESIYHEHRIHHATYPRHRFIRLQAKYKYNNLILCVEHVYIFVLPLCLLVWFVDWKFSVFMLLFGVGQFLMFNKLHAGMHLAHELKFLPRWYRRFCFWNHYLHHINEKTHYCVAFPGADWLFGTTTKMSKIDEFWYKVDLAKVLRNEKEDEEEIAKLDNCLLKQVENLHTIGYVPPQPSGRAKAFGEFARDFMIWWKVGQVEIRGSFPKDKRVFFVANHPRWLDVYMTQIVDPGSRCAAAQSVMAFVGGLVGMHFGWGYGFFSVGPSKGLAVETCANVLKEHNCWIFPEGWSYMSGPTRPFKNGVERIFNKTSNCVIVPVHLNYGCKGPEWLLKLPFVLQCLIFPWRRQGVIITIGEPIESLPGEGATEFLWNKVKELE